MREVAIVSFAQSLTTSSPLDETEMLLPVIAEALEGAKLRKDEIGFTCSGSSDYLGGRPFSFVMALDALGAWPPIEESHVEMDGAFALYEAWVRLQLGDLDTALVYSFGKSSQGDLRDVLVSQLDPYYLAPLAPDHRSLAALQARALVESGRCTERELAEVVKRRGRDDAEESDGVAAIVLATGERARKLGQRPAFIRGIDHRIEAHGLGLRDLTRSSSTAIAAKRAGVADRKVDVAELHAPFAHQELILRDALGLSRDVEIGALTPQPLMSAGLCRLGVAARRIHDGSANRVVAHATSGPCLQQNLVCVLQGDL